MKSEKGFASSGDNLKISLILMGRERHHRSRDDFGTGRYLKYLEDRRQRRIRC